MQLITYLPTGTKIATRFSNSGTSWARHMCLERPGVATNASNTSNVATRYSKCTLDLQ